MIYSHGTCVNTSQIRILRRHYFRMKKRSLKQSPFNGNDLTISSVIRRPNKGCVHINIVDWWQHFSKFKGEGKTLLIVDRSALRQFLYIHCPLLWFKYYQHTSVHGHIRLYIINEEVLHKMGRITLCRMNTNKEMSGR